MEEIIPNRISFSLRELEQLGFMKISTCKKLISQGDIRAFKVGNKLFITRDEVIRYINDNMVG